MSKTQKQTPEELVYLKYLDKNPNSDPFVESSVQLLTKVETISWLFKMVHEEKIKSLSPYLQRILLTKVWKANNYLKSKSYIRDLWKGLGQTTPFFLVPLELVLSNIEEVEQQTTDLDVLAQLKEVKDKIEEAITSLDAALLTDDVESITQKQSDLYVASQSVAEAKAKKEEAKKNETPVDAEFTEVN